MTALELVPLSISEARAFIAQHHRTHRRLKVIARFAVGAARNRDVVAVAIIGNPKSRQLQDGWTAEVVRVCSIDVRPEGEHASCACSMLYAACWRAARALGFRRLVTYTLPAEGGGEPPRRRLDAARRGRRRILVAPRAASRRCAPAAIETPMGGHDVNVTHGHATRGISPTYRSWISMLSRARGTGSIRDRKIYASVSVCNRWLAFENFLSDMGERPSLEYSIDRIDVNGDYKPENCRWATRREQSRNRRYNRILDFNGQTKTVAEWAEIVGLNYRTLLARLRNGWPAERALHEGVVSKHDCRAAKLRWERVA